AGPVIGFRLVYDRETGKPKRLTASAEYKTCLPPRLPCAICQNIEFCGRPLRIGPAAGEQNQQQQQQQQDGQSAWPGVSGPPVDSPYGEKVDPKERARRRSAGRLPACPPEQNVRADAQMKQCIQNTPHEARNMLAAEPTAGLRPAAGSDCDEAG
uniref:SET domain-containing protein n=1 Tax=Macrostomum lignano TaxID=282301 RepID=A0A1I8FPU9_9PLAT